MKSHRSRLCIGLASSCSLPILAGSLSSFVVKIQQQPTADTLAIDVSELQSAPVEPVESMEAPTAPQIDNLHDTDSDDDTTELEGTPNISMPVCGHELDGVSGKLHTSNAVEELSGVKAAGSNHLRSGNTYN